MSPSTQKKMRRIEIFTGCALSAIVIISLHFYLDYTDPYSYSTVAENIFFSLPVAFMSTLPFFSLLIVSILFIIGKFRNPPARYITGTLLSLTAMSNIWQVTRGLEWNISRNANSFLDSYIVCYFIFAACSVICSLTYFGVIRFRKKGSLQLLTYIFAILLIISVIVINHKYINPDENCNVKEIVAISLEPVLMTALCFFPENNSEKTKLNMSGKCGFIFLDLSLLALAINHMGYYIRIPFLLNYQISILYKYEKSAIIAWNIAILIPFSLGIFLAPMLLANKKFDNDKI